MLKLALIVTGGTICSEVTAEGINVTESGSKRLLDYYKQMNDDVTFDVFEPYSILSENLRFTHIYKLVNTVLDLQSKGYDGILVLHGTDTLPYSAAFVGYCCNHVSCPIVFVSSNKPIGEAGSNGLVVMHNAVKFIEGEYVKQGVYVATHSPEGTYDIHYATRINEADHYAGVFTAFTGKSLYYSVNCKDYIYLDKDVVKATEATVVNCPMNFHREVVLLKTYPGINYDNFTVTRDTAAFVVEPYHSGTVCADIAFRDFVRHLRNNGVDVYIASVPGGPDNYVTTNDAMDMGANLLVDVSIPAAMAKLSLYYNSDTEFSLNTNLYREICHE